MILSAKKLLSVGIPVAIVIAAVSLAGPLDPPAGPIAPTYKTLAEVEPRIAINAANTPGDTHGLFRITQPGSYYLTGDIRPAGLTAIEVAASNVTIDLNGFTIDGSAGGATSFGVFFQGAGNVVIRNGTIANCGSFGINGTSLSSCTLIDLAILDNADGGVFLGDDCIIRNVRVRALGGSVGLTLGANALVEGCIVRGGGAGITVQSGAVSRCMADSCSSIGILVPSGSVTECRVNAVGAPNSQNSAAIVMNRTGRIERCVVTGSAVGVFAGGVAAITDSEFLDCGTGLLAPNIPGAHGAQVERNLFSGSTVAGVSLATPGHVIAGNRFHANATNIVAAAGSVIGETITFGAAGGTLNAANTFPGANIAY
jgi:hypothetical protein